MHIALHFPCGGYFFVLSINILSRNNAAAYVEQHEFLYPCYHAGRVLFLHTLFDESEQEIHQIIFFLA